MRASAVFCSLFVATALSVPLNPYIVYENEVVYVTHYVTYPAGYHRHRHTSSVVPVPETTSAVPVPEVTSAVPVPETTSAVPRPVTTSTPEPIPIPTTTSTPEPPPAPKTTSTPEPSPISKPTSTPKPASSASGPTSEGVPLIDIINKWRRKYGLSDLTWSDKLEGNAAKTGSDDGGVNQKHELNDGSMAQVITPGMSVTYGNIGGISPFELSYVAWLCEASSDSQLKSDNKDYCQLVADNLHMQYSSTGHHDILNTPSYKNIGCAFADDPSKDNNTPYQGLWICDLN